MSAQLIKLKEIASSLPGPIVAKAVTRVITILSRRVWLPEWRVTRSGYLRNAAVAVTMEEERSSKPV